MKIYLYDRESGIYLGEDFADEAVSGTGCIVPCDSTTMAPPPAGRGEILVFDTVRHRWEVRSAAPPHAATPSPPLTSEANELTLITETSPPTAAAKRCPRP